MKELMSEKKICSNCSSANQENAAVCAVCRVSFDIEDLADSEFNDILEKEIHAHRSEYSGSIHPDACSKCNLVFRSGARNCRKCDALLTPIKLPNNVIEELPIEGKAFKEIYRKNNILFWFSRISILVLFFGIISLIVSLLA
jgi:RNA polymerase subunit RPABC4/transcription elongation factor Spt4